MKVSSYGIIIKANILEMIMIIILFIIKYIVLHEVKFVSNHNNDRPYRLHFSFAGSSMLQLASFAK